MWWWWCRVPEARANADQKPRPAPTRQYESATPVKSRGGDALSEARSRLDGCAWYCRRRPVEVDHLSVAYSRTLATSVGCEGSCHVT